LDGEWNIVELNGNKLIPEETRQHFILDVAGRKLSGNAGCNQIAGAIEADQKGSIRFERVVSTRKACLDMRLEDELLKTLDEVARFEVVDGTAKTVAFYGINNRKLFVIEKPAD
jgi:heat shock protein HslJ